MSEMVPWGAWGRDPDGTQVYRQTDGMEYRDGVGWTSTNAAPTSTRAFFDGLRAECQQIRKETDLIRAALDADALNEAQKAEAGHRLHENSLRVKQIALTVAAAAAAGTYDGSEDPRWFGLLMPTHLGDIDYKGISRYVRPRPTPQPPTTSSPPPVAALPSESSGGRHRAAPALVMPGTERATPNTRSWRRQVARSVFVGALVGLVVAVIPLHDPQTLDHAVADGAGAALDAALVWFVVGSVRAWVGRRRTERIRREAERRAADAAYLASLSPEARAVELQRRQDVAEARRERERRETRRMASAAFMYQAGKRASEGHGATSLADLYFAHDLADGEADGWTIAAMMAGVARGQAERDKGKA